MVKQEILSLFGIVINFLCNNALMSLLLGGIGLTHFITDYTFFNIAIPVLCIGTLSSLFSWLISGQIKRVTPKNLIKE